MANFVMHEKTVSDGTSSPDEEGPRKLSLYNYLVVAFAAVGSIIYGYDLSTVATTLGEPTFYSYFGLVDDPKLPGYSHTNSILGAIGGVAQAGGFFGCFVVAWTADRYGRRASFQIASIICIISGALQGGAVNIPMFLVFRFVNGVGVGMLLAVTPMYQAELSPPRSRGFLVGQHGFFLALGYNIASWVGLGSYFAKSGALAWRFPLALQALFPIILLIGSIWLPRSPRWLITKDRMEEARTNLARLHRTKDDPNDDFSGAEFDLMVAQVQLERSLIGATSGTIGRWKTLFSRPSYRKRAILGFGLMFGMQGVAPLVINNYQVILFPRLGVGPALSLGLYSVYLGIALVGNFTCGLIIDRLGRRMCFFIGLTGCLCALTGEAIFTSFAVHSTNKVILGFGVFFIFFYIPWWSTFCDPSIYIYISEIWPSEIRSEGIALSTSGQWLASIMFLQASPSAFANIGYQYFIVFIVCTAAMIPVIYFFYPETKNLALEEMGKLFGDDVAGTFSKELQHHRQGVVEDKQVFRHLEGLAKA